MDKKNPMGKEDAIRIQAAESKKEGDTGSFASRAQVTDFHFDLYFEFMTIYLTGRRR